MSERGGTITVSTRSEGELVIIEFADTGPGMAEPARVFDPFYTTRPVGQGIGLGLSACYGIIQQHGGKISGRNRDEGGAIFQVDLPAVAQGTEFAQAQAAK
jgi:signal transduction histidine kinase